MLSYADFQKVCENQLAYALVAGMSPKDFWEGDVTLFWVYMRAAKMKRRQEDMLAWAQGYYNNIAFADVLSAAFTGKGKKHKPIYPEKPIFTSEDREAVGKTQSEKKTAQDEAAERLLDLLTRYNERTNQPFYEAKKEG